MVDDVKDRHNRKLELNEIELENAKMIVSEAEAHIEMVKTEKLIKEIEWKTHKNRIKTLTINHNQVSIELKNK